MDVHTAFFFCNPWSVHAITKSSAWGDASKVAAEKGDMILQWGVDPVVNLMADLEKTFAGMTTSQILDELRGPVELPLLTP